MKIVEDAPGSRLMLKGQTVSIPAEAGLPMFAVVSLFFLVPGGVAWYARSLFPLLFMFGAAVVFSQIWGAIRRSLVGFDVHGPAGEIRISWARLLGGEIEEERVPLADLDTISVRLMAGGSGGSGDAGVRIDLKLRSGLTRTVDLTVESMSRHEEVADFAFRIGAAARLPTSRVVRNDPREVEIELFGGSEPKGPDPLPAQAVPTSPADYSHNRVAPEARLAVAREKTVAFTPPTEFGSYRVDEWSPGVRVVFRRPTDALLIFLLLPIASLILLGPVAHLAIQRGLLHVGPGGERSMVVITGIIGLVGGGMALRGIWGARSRTVAIDWTTGSVTPSDGLRPTEISLVDIAGLDLVCIRKGGGSSNVESYGHSCVLQLRMRGGSEEGGVRSLVETADHGDPDVPYRESLPLATALATALGVKRRVQDYDGRTLDLTSPPR